MAADGTILGLDVGNKRIGLAITNTVVPMPRPLTTLEHDNFVLDNLKTLVHEHSVKTLVVGLPRNLEGEDTTQTAIVRKFADNLQKALSLPIVFQDEALTSVKAESELESRKKPFTKGDIDSLSAVYILEDYVQEVFGDMSS